MSGIIVHSSEPVTLIGGVQPSPQLLDGALRRAPRLVAADGGANWAMVLGHLPEAIIGDLDSVSASIQADFADRLHQIAEQETTDFDKCLRSIAAPLVLGVGLTGGRIDHTLGALNVLVRHPSRLCLILSEEDVTCLVPPRLALEVAAGTTVSLFPMGEVRVNSSGLEWPTDGLAFRPGGRIGTSNRATGPVALAADGPAMLLTLPLDCLDALALALSQAPRWPAAAPAVRA